MERKIYIGDSVYAEFDGFAVTLTTENGEGPSNRIVLEPEVMAQLGKVWEKWYVELMLGNSRLPNWAQKKSHLADDATTNERT